MISIFISVCAMLLAGCVLVSSGLKEKGFEDALESFTRVEVHTYSPNVTVKLDSENTSALRVSLKTMTDSWTSYWHTLPSPDFMASFYDSEVFLG